MNEQSDNEAIDEQPIDNEAIDEQPHDEQPTGRRKRLTKPLVTAVAVGLLGAGVGAGAVALFDGHDGHDRDGGRIEQRADDDHHMNGHMNGRMNGQRDQRGGGQFMPPNGSGQQQGRTGGS